ncbi:MAG TPA: phosphoribosyltransferase family protein [Candidatus Binatia bacterium]|nr:phosphoribosyltransferase family protein [Candidatus Binatia bacterium]
MAFASRQDAGVKMGQYLREQGVQAGFVLGLPRGGVVVAAEVARILEARLDVLVVRKIGHPRHREFAVGAIAEPEIVILDREAIQRTHVHPDELRQIINEEQQRLHEYQAVFERNQPPDIAGKIVLIVDDGLATGSTMEVAVKSAHQRKASEVSVAVPVASSSAFERIQAAGARVYALIVDPEFDAVGRFYDRFTQVEDEEVLELLRQRFSSH